MTSSVAFDGFEIPPAVRSAGMLPRGAAIATSSGALAKTGITEIIHAASGSMTRNGPEFDPSLKGVVDSVRNALALAQARGHRRVALPFIGGKVFLEAIGLPARELVDAIVKTALANRGGLELRFVTFGDEDTGLFRASVRDHAAGVSAEAVAVAPGSITDFRVHGASVIVNAANMEAEFGGGLSGVIARATGREHEINAEARAAIAAFYRERASQ